MNRVSRWLAPLGLLLVLLLAAAAPASAQKVGNPGTFNFKVNSGVMKVKDQEFPFDADQNINFNGTVDKNGNINIPTMTFPVFELSAAGFNLKIHINVVSPTTGTIDPATGAASLRLRVWIKIDGVPLGGGCRIASAASPVDVNTLVTGTSGSGGNVKTGTPYNVSTGQMKLVNATFGVPASSDCGLAGGTVNDQVGLPSPAGNNAAEFNITTTPKLTRAINPVLNAAPTTGTAPFTTVLNATGSTATAGIKEYRWDFTNDGSIDRTTTTPSTSYTYTTGGTQTARVVVVDNDNDTAPATRQLTVNAYPDLKVEAAHTGDFRVGNIETYRVNLKNVGYAATTGAVKVRSTLPAGLSYDSVTGSGWSCSATGQDLECSRSAAIPVGADAPELGVKVKVGPEARPEVSPAFVVEATGDNDPDNDSATDRTTVTATDLKLNLSHDSHAILIGDDPANLIRLSAENIGDAATVGPTVIEDVLPAGLTPVSVDGGTDWSCVIDGQKITCTHAGSIEPGVTTAEIELAVSGALDEDELGVTVQNTATVTTADDVDEDNNTVTDPTLILDGQDVGIVKSHPGQFTAGKSANFTLNVTNHGTKPTTGPTVVTDELPSSLTFISADGGPGWECDEATGTVTCSWDEPLAPGEAAPEIDLKVKAEVEAIPAVENTATVTSPDDPNPANDSSTDEAIVQAIDLTVAKTHQGMLRVGKEATYTLEVKNRGDSPTTDVSTLTDELPAGLTFVSADGGPDWSCAESGGTVTCDHAGLLGPEESAADIELKVMVGAAASPEVTNTASVATLDDFNPANDSGSDTAEVIDADTAVNIQRTGSFRPGQNGTYQVTVRNEGAVPTAAQTDVEVNLGAGLEFHSTSGTGWTCSEDDGTVSCSRPAGLAGDTTAPALNVRVKVGADAVPETTTTVTATTGGDRYPDNDSASDTAHVNAPDLTIEASHDGDLRLGQTAVWNLDVTNQGNGPTTGPVTVTNTVPAGIAVIRASGEGWSCQAAGQIVSCERTAALAPAASAGTIAVEVKPSAAALAEGETEAAVINVATVETENDSDPANDETTDEARLVAVDVSLAADGQEQVAVGETAAWGLTVENTGAAVTEGRIRVTDTVPAGFAPQRSGGDGWLCSSSGLKVKCDYSDTTEPGEVLPDLTIRARAGSEAADTSTNAATVAALGDVISENDTASTGIEVISAPDLDVSLAGRSAAFRVGADAGYELKVRNLGSATASDATSLALKLPAGSRLVGLDHSQGWACGNQDDGDVACQHNGPIAPGEITAMGFRLSFESSTADQVRVDAHVENPADRNPDNDLAAALNEVNRIDLAISRAADGNWTRAATGRYRIEVGNIGTAATVGPVTVTETLPLGTTLAAATGDGWSCAVSGRILTCVHRASVAPGARTEIDVILDVARVAATPVSARTVVETADDANPENDVAAERIDLIDATQSVPARAKVRAGKAAVTRSGVVTAWLRCPAAAAGRCRGVLKLKTVRKVRTKKIRRKKFRKAKLQLGRANYAVAPGRSAPVRVKLGKKAKKALRLNPKIAVRATAVGKGVSNSGARIVIRRPR